jgi:hypothetical protein
MTTEVPPIHSQHTRHSPATPASTQPTTAQEQSRAKSNRHDGRMVPYISGLETMHRHLTYSCLALKIDGRNVVSLLTTLVRG